MKNIILPILLILPIFLQAQNNIDSEVFNEIQRDALETNAVWLKDKIFTDPAKWKDFDKLQTEFSSLFDNLTGVKKDAPLFIYRNNIIESLKESSNLDCVSVGYKMELEPLNFYKWKSLKINLFHLGHVLSCNQYNGSRLNVKEMASEELLNAAIPILKILANNFSTSVSITYVGVTVAYGYKGAFDETYETESASITLIIPISKINLFAKGQITNNDLLKYSDVYILDRGKNNIGLQKIALSL